jgi:hypothetical protein
MSQLAAYNISHSRVWTKQLPLLDER